MTTTPDAREIAAPKCDQCGDPVNHKHGQRCASCIADEMDYDDASECANCGGEGFTYGCSWEWQCDTWDGDSCLCTRRCEWCTQPSAAEIAERQKLREVLAAALAQDGEAPGNHGGNPR